MTKLLKNFNHAFDKLKNNGFDETLQVVQKASRSFKINCTGDVCKGDHVLFVRDIWGGTRRKPQHLGYEIITGVVIKESYGEAKQQHTFTIEQDDSYGKTLIKGRNLYKYGTWRKVWKNEEDRQVALDEKHQRGQQARSDRALRKYF